MTRPDDNTHAMRRAMHRALADLRRGEPILIGDGGDGGDCLVALAAEAADDQAVAALRARTGADVTLSLTWRRANAIGLLGDDPTTPPVAGATVRLTLNGHGYEVWRGLVDPTFPAVAATLAAPIAGNALEHAAVRLAKQARLLPAMLTAPVTRGQVRDLLDDGILRVTRGEIEAFDDTVALALEQVAEARVPLADAQDVRVVAFRPGDGAAEHLAIVVGSPDPNQPVLARLHSECFTGDLLGSLRCDCGLQLRGAIRAMAEAGGGVVLYLAQEGRGIGLINKLRAYELQDRGLDTIDANEALGFEADERQFRPAAEMLKKLGFGAVRLLTNNPKKVKGLEKLGIRVVERVPHAFPANDHNARYLKTKASRAGHLL